MGKLVNLTIKKDVKPLYDIEVKDNHNFVVNNGVVVKNSEQYLSRESLCVLASINAGKFSPDGAQYNKELSIISPSVNRFLDNVNECELRNNTYATPHQKDAIRLLRRTGAGYTNLAGWLFKKNLEYGSESGNKAVADFTKVYNYYLYKNSIELGREKGSFGLFNRVKYEESPFIKRMMALGLEFDAMRNVTCSSIAPTGTLTLMFRDTPMSYGIEQAFGIYYWKRTRISGKYEYYFCVPGIVRQLFADKGCPLPMESDTIKDTWDGKYGKPIAKYIDDNLNKLGVKFRNATEIKPLEKLDMMAQVMEYVDSSISVTYMLPEGSDWKDVYDFILEAYRREVKSIAAFPDRKMYGIVSYIPFKALAVKLTKEGIGIHAQNFSGEELTELEKATGATIDAGKITKTHAPKRPKELPCDIHKINIKGKCHIVLVSLMDQDPYEVMVIGGCANINSNVGKVVKVSRGHYRLICEDGAVLFEKITETCSENEDSLTRMVSTALRHGADIEFIVNQLSKTKGDMQSFAKCIARALKRYIKDGTKVSGGKCPQCQGDLIYSDGCATCVNCNWSKCS